MTNLNAALGLSQIRKYKRIMGKRRRLSNLYSNLLDCEYYQTGMDLNSSTFHLATAILPENCDRDEVWNRMKQMGVTCNVHYKPLPLMTAFKNMGYNIDDYPNCKRLWKSFITLPLYHNLTPKDVIRVAKLINREIKRFSLCDI